MTNKISKFVLDAGEAPLCKVRIPALRGVRPATRVRFAMELGLSKTLQRQRVRIAHLRGVSWRTVST